MRWDLVVAGLWAWLGLNFDQCAYPHFAECHGIECRTQSALPSAQGCCDDLTFSSPCTGGSGMVICGLWDCGPCARTAPSYACYQGRSLPVVACVNTTAFAQLCGGCNPARLGLVYAAVT